MPSFIYFIYTGRSYAVTIFWPLLLKNDSSLRLKNCCFYDNYDPKNNNKRKRRKKTRKKKACPTRLEPGTFIPTLWFDHKLSPWPNLQRRRFLNSKRGEKMGRVKGSGVGGGKKEEKTPARNTLWKWETPLNLSRLTSVPEMRSRLINTEELLYRKLPSLLTK